ncbi:sulfotransferase domain-containing protein [Sphingomonas sp. AOB5]|uniref:sulfotransferase domain-containing protein n=1 Tax=Sphingomonas sp. AOB5 TaxID=3034017 RepID=UPI0023FA1945|nr:sulfotransferase domain-containing protein [Sphingomonas sp. AOB5]MDF7776833.1 sulfotransferase domain-containing protein [Sphingomonas sp. AOB5]
MSGITWLASYPRSGNTWTRLALWTLKHGEPVVLDRLGNFARTALQRQLIDQVLECDSSSLRPPEIEALRPDLHAWMAETHAEPMVKVHDAWRRTRHGRPVHDAAVTRATIYLIRDPRDVAVSWAKFRDATIDATIDYMADPGAVIGADVGTIHTMLPQHIGSWSDNATSWIDESGLAPLVVRYEDLVADPATGFRRIADHLGWAPNEAVIGMAVDATRFDRLAKMEQEGGFIERPVATSAFFRSGRSQGWRSALTPEQAARIERDHEAVMTRFGYL